jgi:hypothetical protein
MARLVYVFYGQALQGVTITGGCAEYGGALLIASSHVTIRNCIITNNHAYGYSGHGGGLYLHTASPKIEGCSFKNNTADDSGGGVCVVFETYDEHFPIFSQCSFTGNTAQRGSGMLCRIHESADYHVLTITNCTFSNNRASKTEVGYGGGLFVEAYSASSSVVITSSRFVSNVATYGGGARIWRSDGAFEMHDCEFLSNEAAGYGGGLYCRRANALFDGCTFACNSAADGGGGSFCATGQPQFLNCTFSGNTALGHGSGICNWDEGQALLENSSVAFGGGAEAVYCEGTSTVTLNCCDVFGNAGGDWVGCIEDQYGINGNISEDPLFCDPDNDDYHIFAHSPCAPENSPPGCGLIGALGVNCWQHTYVVCPDESGDFVRIQDAIDAANNGDIVELCDAAFIGPGNRDIDFSGKAITVRSQSGDPEACIIDCLGVARGFNFQSNEGPNSVLQGVTIKNGSADTGGGISCLGASPTILNCVIADCSASIEGGGLYCQASSPTLTNCLLYGNAASVMGGAMICYSSDPVLTNCTLSGNSSGSQGGGLWLGYADPVLSNCILWGDSPEEIYLYSGSPLVTYCDIQGGWAGEGNIDELPRFLAGSGDFRLFWRSPCIDAGDNTAVPGDITVDLDANPRFVDIPNVPDTGNGAPPIVDMGAYEFQDTSAGIQPSGPGSAVEPDDIQPVPPP